MDYRSPLESMRRELAKLEEELTGLRELPEPKPKPATQSKKAKAKTERESRALQSELAKLENQVRKRTKELGFRELTPREVAAGVQMRRASVVALVLGAVAFSVQLGLAARVHHVWTETTCSFRFDDDTRIASYVVAGRTYSFHASGEGPATARCFVPSPALDGVGRIEPPSTPNVRVVDKLSVGWTLTASLLLLTGIVGLVMSVVDRRRREHGEIEPDDFGADS
ncbi:MAG TPA: hypothetical protein VM925_13560 [Labilithrix sp.]|nr:hypothetical protein [Labilithrix sp.]